MERARWAGLVCALALGGCASDPTAAAQLEGAWGLELRDGCLEAFNFDGVDRFWYVLACRLESGDVGRQRSGGTYDTTGDYLSLYTERSTCDDTRPVMGFEYLLDGDELALRYTNATVYYERVPDEEGDDGRLGTVLRDGCWDEGRETITFRSIEPL